MQSTQQQIFYGVTAISCAYLLYSIAKQKPQKNEKKKNKKNKTPKYTFGTKQWFISCFDGSKPTIDNQNLNDKTKEQKVQFENKKKKQNNKNVKQRSSKDEQIPQDEQHKDFSSNLNQIIESEDQLFFKLGLRLLNSVKG